MKKATLTEPPLGRRAGMKRPNPPDDRRADIEQAWQRPTQHGQPDPETPSLPREIRHQVIAAAYQAWQRREFTLKRAMEVSLLAYGYGHSPEKALEMKLTAEQCHEVKALIKEYQRKVPVVRRDPTLRAPRRKATKPPR